MMGTIENPGVNRRAVKELLRVCKERGEDVSFSIKVSLMEMFVFYSGRLIADISPATTRRLSTFWPQARSRR